jgi:hypothetical protein
VALWRIHAVANPRDARWQGHRVWKEVIVRAETAAMARLVARSLDQQSADQVPRSANSEFWSAFRDEKLYWVQRVSSREAERFGDETGPDEVVAATALKCTRTSVASRQGEVNPLRGTSTADAVA